MAHRLSGAPLVSIPSIALFLVVDEGKQREGEQEKDGRRRHDDLETNRARALPPWHEMQRRSASRWERGEIPGSDEGKGQDWPERVGEVPYLPDLARGGARRDCRGAMKTLVHHGSMKVSRH